MDVACEMHITTQTQSRARVVNNDLHPAYNSAFIDQCMIYFIIVTQLVFLLLFPCLYANKRESRDRGVCLFRNVCNVSGHISGHHRFDYCRGRYSSTYLSNV